MADVGIARTCLRVMLALGRKVSTGGIEVEVGGEGKLNSQS